jgi:tetratricopeptide (TPR) repeat protein
MLHLSLAVLPLAFAASEGSSLPWRRDMGVFVEAEERRRPILIHFIARDCATATGQPSSAGGRIGSSSAADAGSRRSPSGPGAVANREVEGQVDDCRRMEENVWSDAAIASAAERYVLLLVDDGGDHKLLRRYEVGTLPTTLIADPWGNEIVRLLRYVPRESVLRILRGMPSDFTELQAAGLALRSDPHQADSLQGAAAFYEKTNLREIAERYYEHALLIDSVRQDPARHRALAIARGTNLLRMGKAAEAAGVFRDGFEHAREAPQGDVVLFGWLMSELQQAHLKEADRPLQELRRLYPQSPYTAKAIANMDAAKSQP